MTTPVVDPVGIQIQELSPAINIVDTDLLIVQRPGQVPQKIAGSVIKGYIGTAGAISTALAGHISSSDPHGDRSAAASALYGHVTNSDPHGDRAYTNTAVSNHRLAVDPHGDRLFTTTSVSTHSTATDPHGDRAYTNTSLSTHSGASDPHGDRAYTNNQITSASGTTLAPLVGGLVPSIYLPSTAAELSFSTFAALPVTGNVTKLYITTDTNTTYRWTGSTYLQVTGTTDVVAPGTNPDRQYLTDVKNTAFTAKVDNVLAETTSGSAIFSRKVSNTVYVKNIDVEYPLNLENSTSTLQLSDNTYRYGDTTSVSPRTLTNLNTIKSNILNTYDEQSIYRIQGDVFAYTTTVSGSDTLVDIYNKWVVDAVVTTIGVTTPVPIVTTASINNPGTSLTGTGLASSTLEIYDYAYNLLGTTTINTLGNFSKTLSPGVTDGTPLYLYVKTTAGERSDKFVLYSKNTVGLSDITNVSVTSDGLTIRGLAERLVNVTVTDSTSTSLGTVTADASGYWSLTLGTALVNGAVLTLTSVNSLSTTSATTTYTVAFTSVNAPFEVVINNERTHISGTGPISATVNLYDNSSTPVLLQSFATDGTGIFSGTLSSSITTAMNTFNLKSSVSSTLSSFTELDLPTHYTQASEPLVIGILVSSTFEFLYKDITKKNSTSYLDFDLNVNTSTSNIDLVGTNTTGRVVIWDANLKIENTSL